MKRSPTAALWLSICPGVGHVYLGQSMKGLVLIVTVVSTFILADRSGDALVPVALFFWISGAIDAYRSAQEMNHLAATGYEQPRSATQLAVNKWWGWALIAVGVIFFLDNFGVLEMEWVLEVWPLVLIGLGVYILKRPAEPARELPPIPPADSSTPPDDVSPSPTPTSPDSDADSDAEPPIADEPLRTD